ncbi:RNA-binding protein Musashi homolog 2-like [Phalaenopsis equestris]|uniref:RNA-binding protein Musashi homolog 2-like n=1 Tax=Phalaenopsis equestris TaxID=78828 RepID=UPI0009E2F297|nr:RNA-binding protein Musashi homolog 2-like [Phalaenopsis equestris]XP_020590702.1 RNA-binding protein Musashi homolog 2-like [Phalaenopsis equestris]
METDLGKLFIGGISWDTNEDRLREYFKSFGEIVEAVIMKDRTTGRARGFGFVVFADPAVAERVILEKHQIDGRMVEAKKAVPRDDQHILNRNSSSLPGSPAPGRTKKIFVGGLASTVTEADFKKYFEQFGTITDVVVMYDHNTQRPRGFGFITFDSEDAIEKALHKSFHELNGKMVEVKRAVPKELSPGPNTRIPMGSYSFGLNRVNNILNEYNPGFNPSYTGSFGMRMDGRFGQLSGGRKGLPPFSPGYGIGMNIESGTGLSYGGNSYFSSSFDYGRAVNPYYGGNSSRIGTPITYGVGAGNLDLPFSSTARNIWTNGGLNYNTTPTNSNSYMTSTSGNLSGFGNSGLNWVGSSSSLAAHGLGNSSGFATGNQSYGIGDSSFGLVAGGYGRSSGAGSINTSSTTPRNVYEGNYTDSYGGNPIYGDPTWHSASSELDGSSPFAYGFGATASDVTAKGLPGYMGGYNVTNR